MSVQSIYRAWLGAPSPVTSHLVHRRLGGFHFLSSLRAGVWNDIARNTRVLTKRQYQVKSNGGGCVAGRVEHPSKCPHAALAETPHCVSAEICLGMLRHTRHTNAPVTRLPERDSGEC
jgi:hypothetical protein